MKNESLLYSPSGAKDITTERPVNTFCKNSGMKCWHVFPNFKACHVLRNSQKEGINTPSFRSLQRKVSQSLSHRRLSQTEVYIRLSYSICVGLATVSCPITG